MAKTKLLVQCLMAIVLVTAVVVGKIKAIPICNIDSTKLDLCRDAITGYSPPPPTKLCCDLLHHANLPCFCGYKSLFPAFGINPMLALALPAKCGLDTPRECKA